jgi:hypothetical protein
MSVWEMNPLDPEPPVVTVRCLLCLAIVPVDEVDLHSAEDCDGERWEAMDA